MSQTSHRDPTSPRRKRRTADVARREILEAARQRLMTDGPDGLRLKAIADDLGITHSSILHHFGSREQLLVDLRDSGFEALAADLRERIAQPTDGDPAIAFFERVSETLGEQGYGRLLVWQMMVGDPPKNAEVNPVIQADESQGLLDGLATMLHELRVERASSQSEPAPELDETRRIVVMVACTLLGEALTGDIMIRSAGLGQSDADRIAFRGWFAKRVEAMTFSTREKTELPSAHAPLPKI